MPGPDCDCLSWGRTVGSLVSCCSLVCGSYVETNNFPKECLGRVYLPRIVTQSCSRHLGMPVAHTDGEGHPWLGGVARSSLAQLHKASQQMQASDLLDLVYGSNHTFARLRVSDVSYGGVRHMVQESPGMHSLGSEAWGKNRLPAALCLCFSFFVRKTPLRSSQKGSGDSVSPLLRGAGMAVHSRHPATGAHPLVLFYYFSLSLLPPTPSPSP